MLLENVRHILNKRCSKYAVISMCQKLISETCVTEEFLQSCFMWIRYIRMDEKDIPDVNERYVVLHWRQTCARKDPRNKSSPQRNGRFWIYIFYDIWDKTFTFGNIELPWYQPIDISSKWLGNLSWTRPDTKQAMKVHQEFNWGIWSWDAVKWKKGE